MPRRNYSGQTKNDASCAHVAPASRTLLANLEFPPVQVAHAFKEILHGRKFVAIALGPRRIRACCAPPLLSLVGDLAGEYVMPFFILQKVIVLPPVGGFLADPTLFSGRSGQPVPAAQQAFVRNIDQLWTA